MNKDGIIEERYKHSENRLEEYQNFVNSVNKTTEQDNNLLHLIAGLAAEVGELTSLVQKRERSGVPTSYLLYEDGIPFAYDQQLTTRLYTEAPYELGDILWHVTALCTHFNTTLEKVLEINQFKLTKRVKDGTICGEGDHR